MKIALLQYDISHQGTCHNFEIIDKLVDESLGVSADVLVLPETFNSGFEKPFRNYAEDADGESLAYLKNLSLKTEATVISSLIFKERGGQLSNRCVVVADGVVQLAYDKIHTSHFGGEQEEVSRGTHVGVTEIGDLRLSPLVCYDLRFANLFWELAPDVDMYTVVANWPKSRAAHWETLLRARAIENQAFVVGVNRVGIDSSQQEFGGGSVIYDPLGKAVGQLGGDEQIATFVIDPNAVSDIRTHWTFIKDRLPSSDIKTRVRIN